MSPQNRFLALDVFRGMTVCFMIIVNTPGSWRYLFDPLEHAPWHGFTPTDLVFPSFLFAVGNAMAFTMYRYETQGSAAFWKKTVKRTFLIFLIGLLLQWYPFFNITEGEWSLRSFSGTRILGVLQRIALCYFFASVILHYSSEKAAQWFCVIALLLYWGIMYVFGDAGDPYSLEGNAALKLDLAVLGDRHMYHGEGIAFDPEGILSTLSAIVNVIIGYIAGMFIRRHGNSYETIARLMIAGAVLIFIALTWDMVFPINKKIWTSSYVLHTAGIDLLILSVLIYYLEIIHRKRGAYFFEVFGRNPLFIFILAGVLVKTMSRIPVGESNVSGWLYSEVFSAIASPVVASFLYAVCFMLVTWLAGYWLDRKKVYIKV